MNARATGYFESAEFRVNKTSRAGGCPRAWWKIGNMKGRNSALATDGTIGAAQELDRFSKVISGGKGARISLYF